MIVNYIWLGNNEQIIDEAGIPRIYSWEVQKHPDWFNLGVEALNDLASRGILSNPELHIEVLKNADENSQNWLNFVIDSRICKKLNIQK